MASSARLRPHFICGVLSLSIVSVYPGVGLNPHLSYNAAGGDSEISLRRGNLPKRPRPRGGRPGPRQQRREPKRSTSSQTDASLAGAPRKTPEAPRRAEVAAGHSSVAVTSSKPATRHIARDYSYVSGELIRIAIIMLVIVAGLVAAAVVLR
jgi:hypothetical protein